MCAALLSCHKSILYILASDELAVRRTYLDAGATESANANDSLQTLLTAYPNNETLRETSYQYDRMLTCAQPFVTAVNEGATLTELTTLYEAELLPALDQLHETAGDAAEELQSKTRYNSGYYDMGSLQIRFESMQKNLLQCIVTEDRERRHKPLEDAVQDLNDMEACLKGLRDRHKRDDRLQAYIMEIEPLCEDLHADAMTFTGMVTEEIASDRELMAFFEETFVPVLTELEYQITELEDCILR